MGLDCTAYRQLTKAAPGEGLIEDDVAEVVHKLYVNQDFPGRADEFEDRCVYTAAEEYGWRAGSYSGYSAWRDQLATMAGYEGNAQNRYGHNHPETALADKPFFELVWFSDCEGTLGTKTCAKLAKEFAEFQAKADAHPDDRFVRLYAQWRKACEMAADGGAIRFH